MPFSVAVRPGCFIQSKLLWFSSGSVQYFMYIQVLKRKRALNRFMFLTASIFAAFVQDYYFIPQMFRGSDKFLYFGAKCQISGVD